MEEFFIRTEDIKDNELQKFFVETTKDRQIIEKIKSRTPTIIVGSRGAGKSFLLRIAHTELKNEINSRKILPVYLSFAKSPLLQSLNDTNFHHWMISKIASAIIKSIVRAGIAVETTKSLSKISGSSNIGEEIKIQKIAESFEKIWQDENHIVDKNNIPTIEALRDAAEEICEDFSLERISIIIDEAAHIFLPRQQRLFFTLFRELRSPYIKCNAAVYPGVTSFGEFFQPTHDASIMSVERDTNEQDYILKMREIVEKQGDKDTVRKIGQNLENFSILAYAANGNPRILLKTLIKCPRMNSNEVNQVIREYYKTEAWSEHSMLSDKYYGHRGIIDWGRLFIENEVLTDIKNFNDKRNPTEGKFSAYFWVHRNSPEFVRQALRILTYTGAVSENSNGIKSKNNEIGTRYQISLGYLFTLESTPSISALSIAKNLDVRRMIEYKHNHASFLSGDKIADTLEDEKINRDTLALQLVKGIEALDLTNWQKTTLKSAGHSTIGRLLAAKESDLMRIHLVGIVRARSMKNAADAAIYEYLSG